MIRESALLAEELNNNFFLFEKRQEDTASPQLDTADHALLSLQTQVVKKVMSNINVKNCRSG